MLSLLEGPQRHDLFKLYFANIWKQSPEVFYEKRCSWKLHKIHRKTPVPESLLWKKRLWHMCFPVNFAKFLRTPF